MPNRAHRFAGHIKPKPVLKHEQHHYWPYLPLLALMLVTLAFNLARPLYKHGVLAYATEMSVSGLLSATNNERRSNHVSTLSLNSRLTSAAQAKANDMKTRDYWSHTTPDGKEPWTFIQKAGYQYLKAGENLAYGFDSSSSTINGWMNSPSHRENLLDKAYSEVGFGFANSSDFNGSGPETIVVAMYGEPRVLAASNSNANTPTPTPQTNSSTQPIKTTPSKTLDHTSTKSAAVTSNSPIVNEPVSEPVTNIASLTNTQAPWLLFLIGVTTGIALSILLAKHLAGIRHLLRNSEKFVLKHPLVDICLVTIILLGSYLMQTTGYIR